MLLAVVLGLAGGAWWTEPCQRLAGAYDGRSEWTDRRIRARYVCAAHAIGKLDEGWRRAGLGAEQRARRAHAIRHAARIEARKRMVDRAAVLALEARDTKKYGNPNGPAFDFLVDKAQARGLRGDAVFEDIVRSAQLTNWWTNMRYGIE